MKSGGHVVNFLFTELMLYEPELKVTAAIIMMCGAVISLLANTLMVVLVIVVRRLQKSQNAFIVHQLIIDIVKSVHIIMFTKVRVDGGQSIASPHIVLLEW